MLIIEFLKDIHISEDLLNQGAEFVKKEIEDIRKKGDRVYFAKGLGWYIVRPNKRSWLF